MGNFLMSRAVPCNNSGAPTHNFYSSDAWIDGRAEEQLTKVANAPGVLQVASFPDLHPGKNGPVGCAVLADRLHPALVGNDIGCGMALFELDMAAHRIKLDKTAKRLAQLGEHERVNYEHRLEAIGLPDDLFANALGTIGGGNHFCELQLCRDPVANALDITRVYLMVHSGSRGLGNQILEPYLAAGTNSLGNADAEFYLDPHDQAVIWAKLNRQVIAERAAAALKVDLRLIVDVAHNLVECVDGKFLHRKGAAVAGGLIPLAGSRAAESFLIDASACPKGALNSCAHGAGRKFDRRSMHGRISARKSSIEGLQRNPFGGRIICEDKALLIEESPTAYKSSRQVMADLEKTGLARRCATLQPLVTFKKIRGERGQ